MDENGTESMTWLIPGTEAWTLRVRKKFPDRTSEVNLVSHVVRFRLPAGGCRFGSGPGRFWVCVCRLWSGFSFGGVQLLKKEGHRPKNRQ